MRNRKKKQSESKAIKLLEKTQKSLNSRIERSKSENRDEEQKAMKKQIQLKLFEDKKQKRKRESLLNVRLLVSNRNGFWSSHSGDS